MPRGLDHIVHAVRDLDAAAERYRRLGFTVGARNKHPWGTHNYIVQFPGFFIELLSVEEPEKIPPAEPHMFSFGRASQNFLARHEGFAMLVLESHDARADRDAFEAAGVGGYDAFDFEREARRPDGEVIKVAFSLAFAVDPKADAGFFVCQQHYPENFWNPAFQSHSNRVLGVAGVVFVATEPAAHAAFLAAFADAPTAKTTAGGIAVNTPRGVIEVVTPDTFQRRYGSAAPDVTRGMRLGALRLTMADFADNAVQGASKRLDSPPLIARVQGAVLVLEPLVRVR
jgi:catechol 2,3-dioxygenase-like lactoylglutathione lyase family enzyme